MSCVSVVDCSLVWESNPKLRVAGARPNHQADRGSDPNHREIWSPPRSGLGPVRNQVLYHRVRLFSLVPLVWESTTPRVH